VQRGTHPGESFTDVLDRRRVDLFFGLGWPSDRRRAGPRAYSTVNLERAEGWLLVSRSRHHGIYLRADARNRENLRRIADYYAREGVPFDPESGLDVAVVIRTRTDWAMRNGMLPDRYRELEAARASDDPAIRFAGLDGLGRSFSLVGAYEDALAVDREASALRPNAKAARRRIVHSLLRLDRSPEAMIEARALRELDPSDPLSPSFVKVASEYLQRSRAEGRIPIAEQPMDAPLNTLVWLGDAN
jgi:hypothetical protein